MSHRNIARRTMAVQDVAYVVVFLASPARWPSMAIRSSRAGAPQGDLLLAAALP